MIKAACVQARQKPDASGAENVGAEGAAAGKKSATALADAQSPRSSTTADGGFDRAALQKKVGAGRKGHAGSSHRKNSRNEKIGKKVRRVQHT